MTLTRIEYGSLASSELLNNNYTYLDGRISEITADAISNFATINSNIASINSTVTDMNDELTDAIANLNTSVEELQTAISAGGLYITRFVSGSSWYIEYFSDAQKTQRVWLEQGFIIPSRSWSANDKFAYNLLRPFKNTNYTVVATSNSMRLYGSTSYGNVAVEDVSTTKIWIGNDAAETFAVRVYACGE